MARSRYLVFSNPVPGREAEFDAWYDRRHLRDVLATPGFVAAQRFRSAAGEGPGGTRYLAMYEVVGRDPVAALKRLRAKVDSAALLISPTLDLGSVSASLWLPASEP